MNHLHCIIASGGLVAAAAGMAHAEFVYLEIGQNLVGRGVVVSLSGGLTFEDGASTKNVWAGERSTALNGQLARTFSAEVTGVYADGWYQESSLGSGPGESKAAAIGALFGAYSDGFASRDEAAAFQAMLWELVYDFDGSAKSIDMVKGNIAFDLVSTTIFDSMKNTVLRGGPKASVTLIGSDNANDHFRVVPLPSTAGLACVGLLGLASRSRRRG